jgi:hypothetical protein
VLLKISSIHDTANLDEEVFDHHGLIALKMPAFGGNHMSR